MTGFQKYLVAVSMLIAGCASMPDNSNRTASYALQDTRDTTLGRSVQAQLQPDNGPDGFMLLENGLDAFVARAVLAETAERSLDVQYYLYHQDLVGRLFTGYLVKAADRGVRVRILIDDMDMDGRDAGVISMDNHPNIEIRLFNPFDRELGRAAQFVSGLGSITRRMHNKSFTADNQVTILGGRNIGDEYYDADPALEFADLDVLAVGDVVKDVSHAFDLYWNSALSYPAKTLISKRLAEADMQADHDALMAYMEQQRTSDYMTALLNSEFAKRLQNKAVVYHRGNAEVVYDHPEKLSSSRDATALHLLTRLEPYFENVRKELIVISPYFVPGDEGVEFFRRLVDKGVRVVILTNSLSSNDVSLVHAGYSNYRKALLRGGVELYELNRKLTHAQRKAKKGESGSSRASLHAKSFIIDRRYIFVGSLNLDPRSFYENSEIGLVLESEELAEAMARTLDEDIARNAFRLELRQDQDGDEQLLWHGYENGKPVTFDVEPYTGFWQRFGIGIMSLLPIESQL